MSQEARAVSLNGVQDPCVMNFFVESLFPKFSGVGGFGSSGSGGDNQLCDPGETRVVDYIIIMKSDFVLKYILKLTEEKILHHRVRIK